MVKSMTNINLSGEKCNMRPIMARLEQRKAELTALKDSHSVAGNNMEDKEDK